MPDAHANFGYSMVATAPSPTTSGMSLVVQAGDGALFPTPPFNAPVAPAGQLPLSPNTEIVRVTGISGDTLTIVRSQEGTSARAIQVGDQVFAGITVKSFTDIETVLGSALQNGVMNAGDAVASGLSLASGTGALTYSLAAAAPLWVKNTGGVLMPANLAAVSGASLTPGSLPASGQYAVIGIEIGTTGAISAVKGADTATQLNTAPLIASNTPATTSGKLRLFDISVWNNAGAYSFADHTASGVQGVNWIDRRPWARGGFARALRFAGADYTTTSTSLTAVDAANLAVRMECTGVPVRVTFVCELKHATAGTIVNVETTVDAATPGDTGANTHESTIPTANAIYAFTFLDYTIQSAGSHLFVPYWATGAGTATMLSSGASVIELVVEEILRQNTTNGVA